MLKLEDICLSFNKGTPDEATVFDRFNFSVQKGEFVSVVGSNGSGKTTLLNVVCGTVKPDSGRVIFDGNDITNQSEHIRAKKIARVFQDPKMGTCSDLTILENFCLADNKNKPYNLGRAIFRSRIDYYRQLLSSCNMGLEDRMNTPVGSLSGGQRQAIALVISGMTDVDMLILDEHIAALDPKSSERIMELTDKLVTEKKITALMVTHNLRFATDYGSRLVMMHQGKAVVDVAGEEKKNTSVKDILSVFNEISIECGN